MDVWIICEKAECLMKDTFDLAITTYMCNAMLKTETTTCLVVLICLNGGGNSFYMYIFKGSSNPVIHPAGSQMVSCLWKFWITVMIQFRVLLPVSAPFQISTPFECVFINKHPHSNKRPRSSKCHSSNILILERRQGTYQQGFILYYSFEHSAVSQKRNKLPVLNKHPVSNKCPPLR